MDNEVTAALIEAQDNVHYMNALCIYWDPLYRSKPNELNAAINDLLMAIRLVYKTARFFNTSDCVSGLLVKITNQITLTCHNYLTDNNTISIWDLHVDDLKSKMDVSI